VLEREEACDDGNTNGQDGCTAICQIEDEYDCPEPGRPCVLLAVCGDGRVTASETCDDGNRLSGDGCSADCQSIESGWFCPVPGRRCRPLCGDGKLVGDETCDDGNMRSGDGCSVRCQVEPGASCPAPGTPCKMSVCGNGVLELSELCDCGTDPTHVPAGCTGVNGALRGDGKACTVTCVKEPNCLDSSGKTVTCPAVCGDGKLDAQESCDDGNLVDGDGCSSRCLLEAGFTCSTVVVVGNGPRSTCQPRCGDGVLTVDEECDDGAANSDRDQSYGGCTLACQQGFFCGDGIIESMEECDLGESNGDATLGAEGCTLACTRPRFCGDGIVSPRFGEECDLGVLNGEPGQPCTTTCHLF
jgi:cysteine-rich repeat protein